MKFTVKNAKKEFVDRDVQRRTRESKSTGINIDEIINHKWDDELAKKALEDYRKNNELRTPMAAGSSEQYFWVEDLKNWCVYKTPSEEGFKAMHRKKLANDLADAGFIAGISSMGGGIVDWWTGLGICALNYCSFMIYWGVEQYQAWNALFKGDVGEFAVKYLYSYWEGAWEGTKAFYSGVYNFFAGIGTGIYYMFRGDITKHGEPEDVQAGAFALHCWDGISEWLPIWEFFEFANTLDSERRNRIGDINDYNSNTPIYFYPREIIKNLPFLDHNFYGDVNMKQDEAEIACASISDGIILSHSQNYSMMDDDFCPIRRKTVDRNSGAYTGYVAMRMQYYFGALPVVRLGNGQLMLGVYASQTRNKGRETISVQEKPEDGFSTTICQQSFGIGEDKTMDDWLNFDDDATEKIDNSGYRQNSGLVQSSIQTGHIGGALNSAKIRFKVKSPTIDNNRDGIPVLKKW